jgi:hypothetical protein
LKIPQVIEEGLSSATGLPAGLQDLDQETKEKAAKQLSGQPYPFVLAEVQLEPGVTGFVDQWKGENRPYWWITWLLCFLFGSVAIMGLLGFPLSWGEWAAVVAGCVGAVFSWRRARYVDRVASVLAYHHKRDLVTILLVLGNRVIRRVVCSRVDANVRIHEVKVGDPESMFGLHACALAVSCREDRFAVAAQKGREDIERIRPTLPAWIRSIPMSEGEPLELFGDRKLW